jgi:hypothetical protein
MNDCFLVKWIWRLVNKVESLWYKILDMKYLKGKDFFSTSGRGGSQFWRGLHKVKKLVKWGAVHKVGKGDQTRFWIDVWLDRVTLSVSFYELYLISSDPGALLGEMVTDGEWIVNFWRELDVEQLVLWGSLLEKLQGVSLNEVGDSIQWALEKDRVFSTKSLYRYLSFGGVRSRRMIEVW